MASRAQVVGRVARDPQLRRIELGFAGFAVAEHATWIASTLYAYDRGGVGEAGLVAFFLLLPALLVAPIASFAADRFRAGRVLAAGYGAQAAAMLLTGIAIASDADAVLVYVLAAVAASSITLTRPTLGAALPAATHTPADLTAANVIIGMIEYTGVSLGPALGGLLVSRWGHAAPFLVCAGLLLASAALASGLRTAPPTTAADDPDRGGALSDTIDGLRALRDHRTVRMMISMICLGSLVIGASDVLFIATADRIWDGDTARAGLFATAFGVGALVGSVFTVVLVGRARLSPFIASGVATLGLGLVALAAAGQIAVAIVLYALMGAGESVLRVAAGTLVQRVAPTDVVGRFFGLTEALQTLALAIGGGAIGLLVNGVGYETALLIAGVTVPFLLLLRIGALFRIDRHAELPDDRVLELIVGDDIFASLPAPTVERLAGDVERRHVLAGTPVIREGKRGDHYFVIDRGRAEVTIGGKPIRTLGPGDGFGELALLHDTARTATVTARSELDFLAFERELFLQAVTGHARAAAIGGSRSERYLGSGTG
jgi:MFS family permease